MCCWKFSIVIIIKTYMYTAFMCTTMPSKPTGQDDNKYFDQNLSLRCQQTDYAAGSNYLENNKENCAFQDDVQLPGENYYYFYCNLYLNQQHKTYDANSFFNLINLKKA